MTNKERLEANNKKLKSIEFLLEEKAQATPVTEPLTVSANGTYEPATGVDGFNSVEVDVQPALETLAVTINGTYTPSANVYGYSSVSVNVPTAEDLDTELATQESSLTTLETEINALPEQSEPIKPVLATLNVTANGTYIPPTGTDGYNNVIVNVPTTTESNIDTLTYTGDAITGEGGYVIYISNESEYIYPGCIESVVITPADDNFVEDTPGTLMYYEYHKNPVYSNGRNVRYVLSGSLYYHTMTSEPVDPEQEININGFSEYTNMRFGLICLPLDSKHNIPTFPSCGLKAVVKYKSLMPEIYEYYSRIGTHHNGAIVESFLMPSYVYRLKQYTEKSAFSKGDGDYGCISSSLTWIDICDDIFTSMELYAHEGTLTTTDIVYFQSNIQSWIPFIPFSLTNVSISTDSISMILQQSIPWERDLTNIVEETRANEAEWWAKVGIPYVPTTQDISVEYINKLIIASSQKNYVYCFLDKVKMSPNLIDTHIKYFITDMAKHGKVITNASGTVSGNVATISMTINGQDVTFDVQTIS